MNNSLTGFLGTYASPESLGIYRFTIDLRNGAMSYPELYYEAPDCKYLSLRDSMLASPLKREGRSGICLLDTAHNKEEALAQPAAECFGESSPACYAAQDDRYLYTANYHEGTILIYEITYEEGSSGRKKRPALPHIELAKRIPIAPKAGCHQILFHSHYMMVPCLLLDKVMVFDCQKDFILVSELAFDKGTGPRHGIFDRDHKQFFLVSELSNQVFVYSLTENGAAGTDSSHNSISLPDFSMKLLQICPILPLDAVYEEPPASAAIRLSPDQRFLYVSTRFAELITVFKISHGRLEQIQQTGCGGIHPRDMVLTPDGRYLLVANRTQGGLVSFQLNPETGELLDICSRVPAPEAVSIVLSQHTI